MNIGAIGEHIAANYMSELGYKILDKNFRIRGGEIDIVALEILPKELAEESTLIFVEVKTRTQQSFGSGVDAITINKKRFLKRTMSEYLQRQKSSQINFSKIRFDVIDLTLDVKNLLVKKILHIKNVDMG